MGRQNALFVIKVYEYLFKHSCPHIKLYKEIHKMNIFLSTITNITIIM